MTENISPHIFRAYDIRGLYNEDLTPEIIFKIGLAFGNYVLQDLEGKEVVIGRDIRYSSNPLAHSFISAVLATGLNVVDVGVTAFGQTLYAGWVLKTNATVFITASHLPPEWNGIKFYHSDGVGYSEEELIRIRDIAIEKEYNIADWKEIGKIKSVRIEEEYINFFKEKFIFSKKIKVALDCGGGSTTLSAPDVFSSLGLELVTVYCDTDPLFLGRPSDPKPKNLTKLIEAVQDHHCDFGVAFDGDGDRAVIVDNTGKVLSADETGILIGKHGLTRKEGTIIANVECSKAIEEQLEPLGYKIKQIPVGHTFLTIEAKLENSPLGIESSGHIIIPSYFLFDDAIVTPLKIAEILNNSDEVLSDLVKRIPTYPIYKEEIECSDKIKFDVVEELKIELTKEYERINTLDGVRVDLEKGWVLIRPSNTSPLIRMTIEADDQKEIQSMIEVFGKKINGIIKKIQNAE